MIFLPIRRPGKAALKQAKVPGQRERKEKADTEGEPKKKRKKESKILGEIN